RTARSPNSGDNKVTGFQLPNIFTHFNDTAEVFMSQDEEIKAHRGDAVFAVIDLAVGAARSDTKNFHQNSAAVPNIAYGGFIDFDNMSRIDLFRNNGDCLHVISLLTLRNSRASF